MSEKSFALCQDCLKVFAGTTKEMDDLASVEHGCSCGGDVCNCLDCAASAAQIYVVGAEKYALAHLMQFNPAYVEKLRNAR